MFLKIGALKDFTNFIETYLCWGLFLKKLKTVRHATLLKRDFNTDVFL